MISKRELATSEQTVKRNKNDNQYCHVKSPAVSLDGIADSAVKITAFYVVLGLRTVAMFLFL
jgi:hypothetical protein